MRSVLVLLSTASAVLQTAATVFQTTAAVLKAAAIIVNAAAAIFQATAAVFQATRLGEPECTRARPNLLQIQVRQIIESKEICIAQNAVVVDVDRPSHRIGNHEVIVPVEPASNWWRCVDSHRRSFVRELRSAIAMRFGVVSSIRSRLYLLINRIR